MITTTPDCKSCGKAISAKRMRNEKAAQLLREIERDMLLVYDVEAPVKDRALPHMSQMQFLNGLDFYFKRDRLYNAWFKIMLEVLTALLKKKNLFNYLVDFY